MNLTFQDIQSIQPNDDKTVLSFAKQLDSPDVIALLYQIQNHKTLQCFNFWNSIFIPFDEKHEINTSFMRALQTCPQLESAHFSLDIVISTEKFSSFQCLSQAVNNIVNNKIKLQRIMDKHPALSRVLAECELNIDQGYYRDNNYQKEASIITEALKNFVTDNFFVKNINFNNNFPLAIPAGSRPNIVFPQHHFPVLIEALHYQEWHELLEEHLPRFCSGATLTNVTPNGMATACKLLLKETRNLQLSFADAIWFFHRLEKQFSNTINNIIHNSKGNRQVSPIPELKDKHQIIRNSVARLVDEYGIEQYTDTSDNDVVNQKARLIGVRCQLVLALLGSQYHGIPLATSFAELKQDYDSIEYLWQELFQDNDAIIDQVMDAEFESHPDPYQPNIEVRSSSWRDSDSISLMQLVTYNTVCQNIIVHNDESDGSPKIYYLSDYIAHENEDDNLQDHELTAKDPDMAQLQPSLYYHVCLKQCQNSQQQSKLSVCYHHLLKDKEADNSTINQKLRKQLSSFDDTSNLNLSRNSMFHGSTDEEDQQKTMTFS